jgi:hypothetical protein
VVFLTGEGPRTTEAAHSGSPERATREISVNGRRLITDRAGWLSPLPRKVGRG